jgi:nitroreductase
VRGIRTSRRSAGHRDNLEDNVTRNVTASALVGFVVGAAMAAAAWASLGHRQGMRTQQGSALGTPAAQAAVLETIRERRTVRRYQATPVPREDILRILEAAHYAPTAGNQQPWKFLVIQDRAKLDTLQEQALEWYMDRVAASPEARDRDLDSLRAGVTSLLDNALSAPVYVAVLVDNEARYPDYVTYDGTLAAGNLMIAARALGYGTGFFTTFFPEEHMKQFFDIPSKYSLICFTPIGVPEEWPQTPAKKGLDELVVFETFHP